MYLQSMGKGEYVKILFLERIYVTIIIMENNMSISPTPPLDRFVSPPTINSIGTEAFLRWIETPFIHNWEETTLQKEFVVIFSQMTGNWLQETRNIVRVFNTGNHISIRLPVSTEGMARLLNGTNSITKDDFIDACSLRDRLTVIPHKRPLEEKTANKEEFLRALDQPYPKGSWVANLRDKIIKQVVSGVVVSEFWTNVLSKVLREHNSLFSSEKPLPTSPIWVARCLYRIDSISKEVFSIVTGIEFPKKEKPRLVLKTKPVKKPVVAQAAKKNPMQIRSTQEQKDINFLAQQQKRDQRIQDKQAQEDRILNEKKKQKELKDEQKRQEKIRKTEEAEQKNLAKKGLKQVQKAAVKIILPRTYEFLVPPDTVEIWWVYYYLDGRKVLNKPTE